jgi:hypothetical protein
MFTCLAIWKYKWAWRKLAKEQRRINAVARRLNNPSIAADWYSENGWKLDEITDELASLKTPTLTRNARKYDLPLPTDEDAWRTTWAGKSVLTEDGMRALRSDIRKARRGLIEWWVKIVGGTLGIATALFLLRSYLISLRPSPTSQSSETKSVPEESPPKQSSPQQEDSPLQNHNQPIPHRQKQSPAPSQPTPPPIQSIRIVSQDWVPSTDPAFPYQLKVVVQTNVVIQPVSMVFECSEVVERGAVAFSGDEFEMFVKTRSGVLVDNKKIYLASFESPAFVPEKPMVVTLWSKGPIKVGRFGLVPFRFP